ADVLMPRAVHRRVGRQRVNALTVPTIPRRVGSWWARRRAFGAQFEQHVRRPYSMLIQRGQFNRFAEGRSCSVRRGTRAIFQSRPLQGLRETLPLISVLVG